MSSRHASRHAQSPWSCRGRVVMCRVRARVCVVSRSCLCRVVTCRHVSSRIVTCLCRVVVVLRPCCGRVASRVESMSSRVMSESRVCRPVSRSYLIPCRVRRAPKLVRVACSVPCPQSVECISWRYSSVAPRGSSCVVWLSSPKVHGRSSD